VTTSFFLPEELGRRARLLIKHLQELTHFDPKIDTPSCAQANNPCRTRERTSIGTEKPTRAAPIRDKPQTMELDTHASTFPESTEIFPSNLTAVLSARFASGRIAAINLCEGVCV
jgi:hypothetical protein